jgi:hypothetical protein
VHAPFAYLESRTHSWTHYEWLQKEAEGTAKQSSILQKLSVSDGNLIACNCQTPYAQEIDTLVTFSKSSFVIAILISNLSITLLKQGNTNPIIDFQHGTTSSPQ